MAIANGTVLGTPAHRTGSFHPMPVIGHPPAFYERHIKQAEAAGDVHARASHKVGQSVTEGIDPKASWAHKAKCFRHVLTHHCAAPDGADESLQVFYRKLADVVKRNASNEAIHAAQRFNIEATKRIASGEPADRLEDEADDFFIALLGHERAPDWCTRDAADEIARIRQQWV